MPLPSRRDFRPRRAARVSRCSVELSLIQYREGLVNFNTVLATLTAALVQQDLLTVTRGATGTSVILLYKSVGGGWDPAARRTLEDYVPVAIQEQMRERTKAWRKILPGDTGSKSTWISDEE